MKLFLLLLILKSDPKQCTIDIKGDLYKTKDKCIEMLIKNKMEDVNIQGRCVELEAK